MDLKILIGIALAAVAALALVMLLRARPGRERLKAADVFVRIDDEGAAHDLTEDEIDYLETPFLGGDGARPYIKDRYDRLTPDGKIGGFLYRRALPRGVNVKPRA